jgi:hypothetical protein
MTDHDIMIDEANKIKHFLLTIDDIQKEINGTNCITDSRRLSRISYIDLTKTLISIYDEEGDVILTCKSYEDFIVKYFTRELNLQFKHGQESIRSAIKALLNIEI